MLLIYSVIVSIAGLLLQIFAFFIPKINLFVTGRKDVFSTLKSKIKPDDKTIWFHAASLGEYEQGLPVIEKIKIKYWYIPLKNGKYLVVKNREWKKKNEQHQSK